MRAPSLALGEDVREEVREGRQAGPRRDRLRTPFLIRCYRRLPSVFGNRLTTLLCISHVVLLLSEDQFFCFTMSYTAMFEF